ncbi:MAG: type III-B CRISPR module RAMP protein Cmr4 [Vicinamibacterales bacterium]
MNNGSFETFQVAAMAVDPVHVGTGGARLGRVDNTIVRDPVTRVPKIPGSSVAGVLRTYVAMHEEASSTSPRQVRGTPKPYYPDCAGQGKPRRDGGGHCGESACKVCTVFGFARGDRGGFAGLASFSDAHVLLFPVATREGPIWITAPGALRSVESLRDQGDVAENAIHRKDADTSPLNLGWLLLPVHQLVSIEMITRALEALHLPEYIRDHLGVVSDKLFSHVVNSNLEVRTSVAIDPATGAAEEGALFTYEALPRSTVVLWDVTCRNPAHFRIGEAALEAVKNVTQVYRVVEAAFPYLEALGIGGMGTRGMGRLRVLCPTAADQAKGDTTARDSSAGVAASEAS